MTLDSLISQTLIQLYRDLQRVNHLIETVLLQVTRRGWCEQCGERVFLVRRPHERYEVFDKSGRWHSTNCEAKVWP
jgi:hypothetical protein